MGMRDESPKPASEIAESAWKRLEVLDASITRTLARIAIPLLRISLGIVFVWFGALKVFDVSPVSDLVARTVYWVDASWFVPVLGGVEMVIGLGLITAWGLRVILPLFVAQMAGTFLVMIVRPEVAFQDGNPLLLTVEGEFVIKNLVLLSAGLVVGSTVRRLRPWNEMTTTRPDESARPQAPPPEA
jgi:putative oxidoreductase